MVLAPGKVRCSPASPCSRGEPRCAWLRRTARLPSPPLRAMAEAIRTAGVRPEIEVFDLGHIALARHLMRRGARVGFLDGARLYDVRAYATAREAWREWGRSFDLADASAPARQALDLAVVTLAMGLPPLVLAGALAAAAAGWRPHALGSTLLALNLALLALRLGVLAGTRGSYARRGVAFWCSPLADPAATARLWLSTLRRPRAWRGRAFALGAR